MLRNENQLKYEITSLWLEIRHFLKHWYRLIYFSRKKKKKEISNMGDHWAENFTLILLPDLFAVNSGKHSGRKVFIRMGGYLPFFFCFVPLFIFHCFWISLVLRHSYIVSYSRRNVSVFALHFSEYFCGLIKTIVHESDEEIWRCFQHQSSIHNNFVEKKRAFVKKKMPLK